MDQLQGKVVVVTGAGRGIGRAVARRAATEGAKLSLCDTNETDLEQSAKEVASFGAEVVATVCDVGVRADVDEMVRRTVERFATIDVVVNNAQRVPLPTPAEDITDAQWDTVGSSGAFGALLCCQAAFPHLKTRGGSIINFSSAAGLVGAPWLLPYAATKAAMIALTYTLAQEWGKYRIRVNAVAPAAFTPASVLWVEQMTARVAETGEPAPSGIATDFNRMTSPLPSEQDPEIGVAPVVIFLASDGAVNVTGQTICVDGGIIMH